MRGIHSSPVDPPKKCQNFYVIMTLAWNSCWTNNRVSSDFRRYDTHVALNSIGRRCESNPPDTWRNDDVFSTSKRRRRRRLDVMKTLLLRCVPAGKCVPCTAPESKVYRAHMGPTGPRWAPCWPHEPCYLGPFSKPGCRGNNTEIYKSP